jgi:hypothetical protein
MRPTRAAQTSFTSGEIGPTLAGRIEVAKYYAGAALLRNLLVRPQGGVRRRPGMLHVGNLPGGETGVRLIPFAFNTEQTYVIALTNAAFRVFRGPDGVELANVTGCPWNGTQASQMNFAQSADTLLLAHPDVQPQRIRRGTLETTWTRDAAPLINLPTYDYGAVTPTGTMTASGTTGAITITASAAVFTAGMVGWAVTGNGGSAYITGFTSSTQVNATVRTGRAFANTSAFSGWLLEEPVISATRGWPECVTFHQARLWYAGFKSRPATFMASKIADFWNFDGGSALDDEAISATIDTNQVNAIHQLASGRALQLFTSGAEHIITGDPITPKTIGREEQTRRGIKRFVPTAEIDGAQLFVQRGGAALRQFLYVDIEQAWRADVASLLAPHLILDPIDMAARKSAALDDADHVLLVNPGGTVTAMTTLRSQEILGFSRWETDGEIKAVAALASGEVYFATLRNATVRLERWDADRYLDASVVQTGGPFTVVTGLAHLNGLTVGARADGNWQGTFTVAGGQITLPREATEAEVGLLNDLRGLPMPYEARDPSGNLIGRRVRVAQVTARVVNTSIFQLRGQDVVLRQVGAAPAPPLDSPQPIFTGDVTLRGLVGWEYRAAVEFSQPIPGPFELLALSTSYRLGD